MRLQRNRAISQVAKPGHGIDRNGRRMAEGFPGRQPAKRVGIREVRKCGGLAAPSLCKRHDAAVWLLPMRLVGMQLQEGIASIIDEGRGPLSSFCKKSLTLDLNSL